MDKLVAAEIVCTLALQYKAMVSILMLRELLMLHFQSSAE